MSNDNNALKDEIPANPSLESAIITDWHDGPIEGFLKFASTAVAWHFVLFAERRTSDDLDDRLFLLFRVSLADLSELVVALGEEAQSEAKPLTIPSWQFETETQRQAANAALSKLLESSERPEYLIRMGGLAVITDVWTVDRRVRL